MEVQEHLGVDRRVGELALGTPERRFLRSRYGETTTRIAVDLYERGVGVVLQKSRSELEQAYLEAWKIVEGKQPGNRAREDAGRFARVVEALASVPDTEAAPARSASSSAAPGGT